MISAEQQRGEMYDDETARRILREAVRIIAVESDDNVPVIGFDPDALNDVYEVNDGDTFEGVEITAMIYFAQKGDEKMCRYLLSRGASTTQSSRSQDPGSDSYVFPMCVAAGEGNLAICKFLYENDARDDVRRNSLNEGLWTTFHEAAWRGQHEVVQWLTLNGALCTNDSSETFQKALIYPRTNNNTPDIFRSLQRLVKWAQKVTQSHSALVMFLLGTLPPALDMPRSRIIQDLSGHPGIRKHIGDFVGLEVTKGEHLRILLRVVDELAVLIRTEDEE